MKKELNPIYSWLFDKIFIYILAMSAIFGIGWVLNNFVYNQLDIPAQPQFNCEYYEDDWDNGEKAGYTWACEKYNSGTFIKNCGLNSESFIRGCGYFKEFYYESREEDVRTDYENSIEPNF